MTWIQRNSFFFYFFFFVSLSLVVCKKIGIKHGEELWHAIYSHQQQQYQKKEEKTQNCILCETAAVTKWNDSMEMDCYTAQLLPIEMFAARSMHIKNRAKKIPYERRLTTTNIHDSSLACFFLFNNTFSATYRTIFNTRHLTWRFCSLKWLFHIFFLWWIKC